MRGKSLTTRKCFTSARHIERQKQSCGEFLQFLTAIPDTCSPWLASENQNNPCHPKTVSRSTVRKKLRSIQNFLEIRCHAIFTDINSEWPCYWNNRHNSFIYLKKKQVSLESWPNPGWGVDFQYFPISCASTLPTRLEDSRKLVWCFERPHCMTFSTGCRVPARPAYDSPEFSDLFHG